MFFAPRKLFADEKIFSQLSEPRPRLESRGVVKNPVALLNKPGAIMSKKQKKALMRMQLYSHSS